MPLAVTVTGADKTAAQLARRARQAEQFGRSRILIGSSLTYAYGIETGVTRSGRLARRAGGAHYLAGALEQRRGDIRAAVRAGAVSETADGRSLLLRVAHRVLARAMALVPVRTGTLRRSLRVVERGR